MKDIHQAHRNRIKRENEVANALSAALAEAKSTVITLKICDRAAVILNNRNQVSTRGNPYQGRFIRTTLVRNLIGGKRIKNRVAKTLGRPVFLSVRKKRSKPQYVTERITFAAPRLSMKRTLWLGGATLLIAAAAYWGST